MSARAAKHLSPSNANHGAPGDKATAVTIDTSRTRLLLRRKRAFVLISAIFFWAVPAAFVSAGAFALFLVDDVVSLIWLGSVVNAIISVAKAVLAKAMPRGGKALMADAVHGLGDSVAEVVSAVAFVEASRPPDLEHPWGHGKIESIGALAVAGILLYVACTLGWESCTTCLQMVRAYQQGLQVPLGMDTDDDDPCPSPVQTPTPRIGCAWAASKGVPEQTQVSFVVSCFRHPLAVLRQRSMRRFMREAAVAVTLASLVLKEALFHATLRAGQNGASRLAVATAWHHRSDSLAAGAALVSQVGAYWGQHYMDPLGSGVVATMLAHSAGSNLWESLQDLIDYNAAVDDDASAWAPCGREALGESIITVPGVLNHTLRTRRMGPFCMVDATIVVEARISASAASMVAEAVHDRVIKDFHPYVTDVIVHVDPQGSPQSHRLDTQSEVALSSSPEVAGGVPEPLDVEEQVRSVLLTLAALYPDLPAIQGISEVQTYFYNQEMQDSPSSAATAAKVAVKVDVRLPQETLLKDARLLAGVARKELLAALPQLVGEVDIDLELDEEESVEGSASPQLCHNDMAGSSMSCQARVDSGASFPEGGSLQERSWWTPGSSDDAARHLRRVTLIWHRGVESRQAPSSTEFGTPAVFPRGAGGPLPTLSTMGGT